MGGGGRAGQVEGLGLEAGTLDLREGIIVEGVASDVTDVCGGERLGGGR